MGMAQTHIPILRNIRDFLSVLDSRGDLARIGEPVSTMLEVTELHRRTIEKHGPALHFERPIKADGTASAIPLVTNLFGTVDRVALAIGDGSRESLRHLGIRMAELRQPTPPSGLKEIVQRWPLARTALNSRPQEVKHGAVQAVIKRGQEIDLGYFPVQTCWPGETAARITWPSDMSSTPGEMNVRSHNGRIQRKQVPGRDRAIVRWIDH